MGKTKPVFWHVLRNGNNQKHLPGGIMLKKIFLIIFKYCVRTSSNEVAGCRPIPLLKRHSGTCNFLCNHFTQHR